METVDVFKADRRTIDTQKVTFAIWKNRKNGAFIRDFTETLCKFVEEKRVFNEIEFYLPQLAHLIIHLEEDWAYRSLERFALCLSQTSMHTALQLCFMLTAAMEDYQPENTKCEKNADSDPAYFFRCSSLLRNIERVVVFGTVCMTEEMMEMMASLPTTEFVQMVEFEKNERISRIINSTTTGIPSKTAGAKSLQQQSTSLSGNLLYKKDKRTSMFVSKGWSMCYFKMENRVLLCYDDERSHQQQQQPVRAIPLSECELCVVKREKYQFQFELVNNATTCKYQLRAASQAEFDQWIQAIRKEALRPPECPLVMATSAADARTAMPGGPTSTTMSSDSMPPKPPGASSSSVAAIAHAMELTSGMTPNQRKRFACFQQQRAFVKKLAEICEKLRFVERDVRKDFLKKDLAELSIPPFCYLPLCRSVDPWRHILRVLPSECHAFSTKARCPALVIFEIEESVGVISDVSTFLSTELHEYTEAELTTVASVEDALRGESLLTKRLAGADAGARAAARLPVWKPQGTGLLKLKPEYARAVNIPNQTVANNEAMRANYEAMTNSGAGASGAELVQEEAEDLSAKKVDLMGGKETFLEKTKRLRGLSPYGHLAGWKLDGLIAKSNDDLRQEQFVMQLIIYYQIAFQAARVPVWLYTYRILSTSKTTGLIQLIPDAISLDGLKKRPDYPGSLRKHFEKSYGLNPDGSESPALKAAIKEYLRALAGYSIVTYLLDIKDRHNGNVMIDSAGHLIHIDFGFVFGLAPGKQFSMEKSPWKLTEEMVDVVGGRDSAYFREYTELCVQALQVARTHAEPITLLMEIMSHRSNFPAFKYNASAIKDFRRKMMLRVADKDLPMAISKLIASAYKNTGSNLYDSFQLATNGIAK